MGSERKRSVTVFVASEARAVIVASMPNIMFSASTPGRTKTK